ncbi:ATP-binding protein [Sneathiella chinensis]|uniref:histidine kinase n=1 Tax=Sneathiella chinensis TaxID=349750 RepID=A0ABQ5U489_9PROT|nr:ATP-binding protein [Sneathiella chinensis]GLQ06485.1 hypothetical protein GCM10007924_17060 [Sneathiella chinensis]
MRSFSPRFIPRGIGAKVNLAFAVICSVMIGTLVLSWLAFEELGDQITEFSEVRTPSLAKSINLLGIANSFHEAGPTLARAPDEAQRRAIYGRLNDYLNRMGILNIAYEREGLDEDNKGRIDDLVERLKTSLTLLNTSAQYRIRLLRFQQDRQALLQADHRHLQKLLSNMASIRTTVGSELVSLDRLSNRFHDILSNDLNTLSVEGFSASVHQLRQLEKDMTDTAAQMPSYVQKAVSRFTSHIHGDQNLVHLKEQQLQTEENATRELDKIQVKITQIRLVLSLTVKRTEDAIKEATDTARNLISLRTAQLALAVIVVVLTAFFASLVFVRRSLVRRLTKLGQSMQKIAEGQLDTPIDTRGHDEISRMADALVIFRNTAREVEEQQTRAIIESSVAGLVMTDDAGRIEFFSHTARQLFGYPADISGQSEKFMADLISDKDRPALAALLSAGNEPVPGQQDTWIPTIIELTFRTRDGTCFPGDIACRTVRQRSGIKRIFTIYDVTDRKQAQEKLEETVALRTADLRSVVDELRQEVMIRKKAEQSLRNTREELVQASKLASLGKMASGISHELNQPLMAVSNWIHNATLLIDKGDLASAGKALQDMDVQVVRMIELASHLRTLARQPDLSFAPTDPAKCLGRALDLFSTRISQDHITVSRQIPEGAFSLQTDGLRLEQIFINLISNAFDAMQGKEERELTITATTGDTGLLTLSFSDTGSGLEEAVLPHVFDPFFSTKDVGQGMGLGLSISYNIARTLGGTLTAHNNGDWQGATFTLSLPTEGHPATLPVQAEEIW